MRDRSIAAEGTAGTIADSFICARILNVQTFRAQSLLH
jgi:hypothetical protein